MLEPSCAECTIAHGSVMETHSLLQAGVTPIGNTLAEEEKWVCGSGSSEKKLGKITRSGEIKGRCREVAECGGLGA